MLKKKKKQSKLDWLWEFSKKIVWIVTLLFLTVFVFCSILLIFYPDSTAIPYVIEHISDVFKVTVVSYAVKAGIENVFKIRRDIYGMASEQLGFNSDPGTCSNRFDIPGQE